MSSSSSSSSSNELVLYKEESLEILILEEEDKNFHELTRILYDTLVLYVKDFKVKTSWVGYYSDLLSIKFPEITFDETKYVFEIRMIKILDLMELSHLYCKIANTTAYVKDNHLNLVTVKTLIVSELKKLDLQKFDELRLSLKNSILNGNN